MTDFTIGEAARKDLAANPQLSGDPAAQLHRFLALEDILIGFSEGIDGPRLEAGLTWAKHGSTKAGRRELISLFASRPQAAKDEGAWDGNPMAEGEKDLAEATATALLADEAGQAGSRATSASTCAASCAQPYCRALSATLSKRGLNATPAAGLVSMITSRIAAITSWVTASFISSAPCLSTRRLSRESSTTSKSPSDRRDGAYWRSAYEELVRQTGRDLNDGYGACKCRPIPSPLAAPTSARGKASP